MSLLPVRTESSDRIPECCSHKDLLKSVWTGIFQIGYCLAHHSVISGLSKIRNPKSILPWRKRTPPH